MARCGWEGIRHFPSEIDWERLGIETPVKLVSQIAEEVRQAEFQGLEEARRHMDAVLQEALRQF
jgi:hypothetical protein